jgi:hypothetical protein
LIPTYIMVYLIPTYITVYLIPTYITVYLIATYIMVYLIPSYIDVYLNKNPNFNSDGFLSLFLGRFQNPWKKGRGDSPPPPQVK